MHAFSEIVEFASTVVFGVICHQNPSLLLEVSGQKIMLCPRCSGLHTGFFCCVWLVFILKRGNIKLTSLFSLIFCASAITIVFLEWLMAQLGISQSTVESRYITGLMAGCAFGLLLMAYRTYYLYAHQATTKNKHYIVIILLSILTGLALSQLNNRTIISLLLLIAVIVNLFIIAHSILIRVYVVLSKNHKI